MDEAIAHGVSTMLPLLGLLAIVFGGLIIVALVLRFRILRENKKRFVKAVSFSDLAQKGDMLSVLGRGFTVDESRALACSASGYFWVCLSSDESKARLVLDAQHQLAVSFPGPAIATEERGFPESISRDGVEYRRFVIAGNQGVDSVALYKVDSGLWLALEGELEDLVLWRGKEIPPEGVTVLHDGGG